jgi:hypothetical protein
MKREEEGMDGNRIAKEELGGTLDVVWWGWPGSF